MRALVSRLKNNEYQPLSTQKERLTTRQVADADTRAIAITPRRIKLSQDVLGEISLYLPLQSFLVFRKVCKQFLEGTKQPARRINKEFFCFLQVCAINILKSLSITDSQAVVFNIRDCYSNTTERFLLTDITPSEFHAIPLFNDEIIRWLSMSSNQVVMKKILDTMTTFVTPSNRLRDCQINMGYAYKKHSTLFRSIAFVISILFIVHNTLANHNIMMPLVIDTVLIIIGTLCALLALMAEINSDKITEYYNLQYQGNERGIIDPRLTRLSAGARLFEYVIRPSDSHNNAEESNRGLSLRKPPTIPPPT